VAAVLLGGSALFVQLKAQNKVANHTVSEIASQKPADDEIFWRAYITQVGGVQAYKQFSNAVARVPVQLQHSKAHIFGRLLYEVEGIKGFQACDMQFSMGCYHEFFAQAIARNGRAAITQFGEVCASLPVIDKGNCRHGIGHGIQSWLGYTPADLVEGIALCAGLPGADTDAYGGCVSGLYMEYNLRTMIASSTSIRTLVEGDYNAPCDSVLPGDQSVCAFWLPSWWYLLQSHKTTPTSQVDFAELGDRCRALPFSLEVKNSCFRGIARNVVSGEASSTPSGATACDIASETVDEKRLCRSFLALIYFNLGKPQAAESACAGLQAEALLYCKSFASGKVDFPHMTPLIEI